MTTAVYGLNNPMAITTGYAADTVAQQEPEEQYISTFFCRALYDYQTQDASSLSFRKGDIIEVLTRLESGWWDGLLGDERGWFPSNYVAVISDEEAEAALAPSVPDTSVQQVSIPDDSVIDMAQSMSQALSSSSRDADWLQEQVDYPSAKQAKPIANQQQQLPNGHSNGTGHNDFWVPQVSHDGRIFYVNTQTGQHSQDLPQEAEDPDGDLVALSPSSRTGNTAVALAAAHVLGQAIQSDDGTVGFGVPPQRTRTPEPWVRRLADDGRSYYYRNKLTGQVQWTVPEADEPPSYGSEHSKSSTSISTMSSSVNPSANRLRSDSAASSTRGRSNSAVNRASVYSDDSDVQPLPRDRNGTAVASRTAASSSRSQSSQPPQSQSLDQFSLTPAEEIAQALHTTLIPPPPASTHELAYKVREAITAVVDYLQSAGPTRGPEHTKEIDRRVLEVVVAVRNLLYVAATPTGHIPSHLYPRGASDRGSSLSQGLQSHLKPAHRKVAGTLSKLVLSALAMHYDPVQSMNDKPNRMESDAAELERSVFSFVEEVQRYLDDTSTPNSQVHAAIKRLYGTFLPEHLALGLPGAGAAGSWKGFGFVPTEGGVDQPSLPLEAQIVQELKVSVTNLHPRLLDLVPSSRENIDLFQFQGQSIVAYMSALLAYIHDINIAQHVDIDGIRSESGQPATFAQYMQTVEKARHLLRTIEYAVQMLYDDTAGLFLTVQGAHVPERYYDPANRERAMRSVSPQRVESYIQAIYSNLNVLVDALEGVLNLGHEQAQIGQATYRNSLDWRRSRLSILDSGNIDPLGHARNFSQEEDVVDMELAFSRPGMMRAATSVDSAAGSTLYQSSGQYSESSLNMSDRSRSDAGEPVTPTWPNHESTNTLVSGQHTPQDDALSILDDNASQLFDEDGLIAAKSPPRPSATGSKLEKLLGEAPAHYINKLKAESKPWYLRPNYDSSEILIDPDGGVRAGTPAALVERLTAHEQTDPTFNKYFLMTYKSFMTLDELFKLLVDRYWIQPPDSLTPTELEDWTKQKQHLIRMRVLNTFKTMITDDDLLEKEDMYILDQVKQFVSHPEVVRSAAAKQLLVLIDRAQKGGDAPIKTTNTIGGEPPPPILPKASKKLKLLDIDPMELARQLTLMEAMLYKKIRPMECLARSRESKPGKTVDNITAIIQLSNRIANWVADSVLEREDSRKRAAVVKHFISVADRCRTLQNFSTMTAIVSGLNTPPIRRLKRTWEQVNARFMSQLSVCESTIDTNKNFNNYRTTLAKIAPPCVPFIGVYLTTLTFINDGAEDKLAGHMINFRKRQKAAEVIQDIKRWQAKPFIYHLVTQIREYLEDSFNKYSEGVDYADQFWNLSLEREPREREDEKMARLLQESGFL